MLILFWINAYFSERGSDYYFTYFETEKVTEKSNQKRANQKRANRKRANQTILISLSKQAEQFCHALVSQKHSHVVSGNG